MTTNRRGMSVLQEITVIKTEIEKLRKEAKEKVESIFKTAALELFTEYPNLKRFSWTQYTPYFNDGDPCTFRSSHYYPAISFTSTVVEEDEDYDDYEEEWSDYKYYDYSNKKRTLKPGLSKEQRAEIKTAKAVLDFLGTFDDEDMENLFGDGYKVIITSKGIEVEDYDHD
jgi:hypothetical protein